MNEVCAVAEELAGGFGERQGPLESLSAEFVQDGAKVFRYRLDVMVAHDASSTLHELPLGAFGQVGEPHGRAKVHERVDLQEPADHTVEVGADRLGAGEKRAVSAVLVEDRTHVGRIDVRIGVPVGPTDGMLPDEPVLVEGLEDVFRGPDPHGFPYVGIGDGIGPPLELDMAVRVNGGLLPLGNLKGLCGKGEQGRSLALGEDDEGFFARRAVKTLAVLVQGPVHDEAIEFTQRGTGIEHHDPASGVADSPGIALNFSLIFWMHDACGVDKRAEVLGHVGIGAVELGIVEVGRDDAALKVVDHQAPGDSAEVLEHPDVGAGKAHLILAKGKLDVLEPAMGKGPDEGVQSAPSPFGGVEHRCDKAVIDLGFLAGPDLDAAGHAIGVEIERMRADEALEGCVAHLAAEIMLQAQDHEGALGRQGEIPVIDELPDPLQVRNQEGLSG